MCLNLNPCRVFIPCTDCHISRLSHCCFLSQKSPYVMQGPKGLEGYIIDLVGHIARIVPFTFELHLVRDGKGIGRRTRGTAWDGMIGELLRGVSKLCRF